MNFRHLIVPALLLAALAGCGTDGEEGGGPASAGTGDVAHQRSLDMAGWDAPDPVAGPALRTLDDHFKAGASLTGWGYLEGDFGRNRIRVLANGRGQLEVTPARGAWADDQRAFYLYRNVRGDFDVRARLRVTGVSGAKPAADRSLSGLLVRAAPQRTAQRENWLSFRIGIVADRWAVERKSTIDSRSRPAFGSGESGWVQLRIVRRGEDFVLWQGRRRRWDRVAAYRRPDLPAELQVGVDAFSGAGDRRADLVSHVDWVRFRPVR